MSHKKFQDLNINKSYFCKSDTNRTYIVFEVHFTCILTETTKIYEGKFVGLKNHFFLILNINHIINIICPYVAKTHWKIILTRFAFSVNFSNCQFGFHVLEYYLAVKIHIKIR
jgi:hypothetical protein